MPAATNRPYTETLIALGDAVTDLALDTAPHGSGSALEFASDCAHIAQQMACGIEYTISANHTFQCMWLAEMGWATGPAVMADVTCTSRWTFAA